MPEAFSWFLTWLYFGVVNVIKTKQDACIAFETYLMADKFIMVVLKNDLMDAVRRFYARTWMEVELLEVLAKHEGFEGKLKSFGLDQLAFDLHEDTASGSMDPDPYMPSSSFYSAINAFLAGGSSTAIDAFWAVRNWTFRDNLDPSSLEGCYYHEHPSGSPACKFAAGKGKE